jgi:hypothetical protein
MEITIAWHIHRVERLEHDAAGNLRCYQVSQPSGAAPPRAGDEDASAHIWIGIDIEMTANQLNAPPIAFSEPKARTFQVASTLIDQSENEPGKTGSSYTRSTNLKMTDK